MKPFRDLPIQKKMLLMTLLICGAVLLVAIVALFTFQVLNFRSSFQRDTATLAAIIANNSTAALAFKDAKAGAEVVGSLQAKPTVVSATLVLPDGTLFAEFGASENAAVLSQFPTPGKFRFSGRYMLYTKPVELDKKQVGTLYLRSDYRRTLVELLGFYGLVILGVIIASVILAVLLSGRLQRVITDPILQLAQTAQTVGEKKDYSLRVTMSVRGDELGQLAGSFNEMLARIQSQDQALKESRERFEVAIAGANDGIWDWNLKTNEVFFSPQWKRILGYSNTEIENTVAARDSLLHPEDIGYTRVILQDYLEGRRPTYEVEFRMREKSGQYRWILARGAAVRDAENKPYRMAGSHTDINGRKQAEVEVRLSREKFEALVNSIDGIVWECNTQTMEFTFVSQQSTRILGYTPEQWLGNLKFWQEHLHQEDTICAIQAGQDAVASRKPYNHEYRMIAADGRAVWIRESGDVLLDNDGQPKLVRGIFQDITEHKLAAAELDKLNKQLMETSRHAGMAEVATGVLHNVGNVLNSVNVSSTLIHDKLRNSEITSLVQLGGLLRQHEAGLAIFLTDDPRGKLIPGFIIQLADQLGAEQVQLQEEQGKLSRNIEHIKEIVSMQQNYASVSGVLEPLSLAKLVDDALQMNTAGLSRHGVQVIRQYADVPPATADKHKVLQILVNLMHNAKYALDASPTLVKKLTVGIGLNGNHRLKVTVSDNGIGIPPENLTRIFAHGFSTRKGGHGFGLHSGANAAKEMGGQLIAHSEGLGRGATFILELPLAQPKAEHVNGEKKS
jgi:PAS domain S-box-containing protein